MKVIIFSILVLLNCNRGPAEDRAKRNCDDTKLLIVAIYNDRSLSDNLKNSSLFLLDTSRSCNGAIEDSLLNRYYRGYVKNEE